MIQRKAIFSPTSEKDVTRAIVREFASQFDEYVESDVVIVGAGPSGLVCGKILAKAGLKVLIVEKNNYLGGGFWIGGYLMNKVTVREPADRILDKLNVPHKVVSEGLHVADGPHACSKLIAAACDAGHFRVNLPAMKADGKVHTLTVKGKNTVTIKDVLIGEVWICSGQSNMEWAMGGTMNAKEEIAAAKNAQIRLFDVPGHVQGPTPLKDPRGKWQICSPGSVGRFSAVGYFFGRALQKELKVPIGLVGTIWGGTRIEPWTPLVGFKSVPQLQAGRQGQAREVSGQPGRLAQEGPRKPENRQIVPRQPADNAAEPQRRRHVHL